MEVDAAPSVDLNRVLNEVRSTYEAVVETNRREVEEWYTTQVGRPAPGHTAPQVLKAAPDPVSPPPPFGCCRPRS